MEYLLETLNENWAKADAKTLPGLEEWQIGRHEFVTEGTFRYAIRDLNGRRKVALLVGAKKKDPLHGVANCQLKLEGDKIIGINVDGDCALQVASKND